MNHDFKLILNLTKGYKSEDGRLFVEGIASGTDLDLTGERMSPDAIKSMADSLNKGMVEFRSEHSSDWDSMFGAVTEMTVTPDNQLHYKAELDPGFSKSHDLLHALAKGKKLGVSIGGQVIKAGMEWVEELQRSVYTYFDIALKEISVTAQPAYAQAWVSQITKSINRDEVSMPDVTKTDETVEEVQAPAEQAPEAPAAPADEAPAAPEAAPESESPEAPATDEAPATEVEQETPAESTPAVEEAPDTAAESTENAATDAEQEQEAEAPEAASHPESAPEGDDKPLDETQKSVQKSDYLGEYAEASMSYGALTNLSDALLMRICDAICDEEMAPQDRIAMIDAMLMEFHDLAVTMTTALITADAQEPASDDMATMKSQLRPARAKSLTAKTEELDAVIKSLATATKQVTESQAQAEALQKSVDEKDAAIAAANEELAKAQKALADAETKAKIVEARKAYQITSKFALALDLKEEKQPTEQELHRAFAARFAGK